MNRPARAEVQALLDLHGRDVHAVNYRLTEDVDGNPLGVDRTTEAGMLDVHLEPLGWTQAEWDDPTITE